MIVRFRKRNISEDGDLGGNIFWITMSDLLLGLAIVFISLFIFAFIGFTQNSIKQKQVRMEISEKISQELKKANIDASVDKMTGDLRIPSVELFNLNSYVLTPKGKQILDKVSPIYINTIFSNKDIVDQIENIVVEGHTDSQMFSGIKSKDEQFIRNMELSLKRANSVAEYMFRTNYNKEFNQNFKSKLIVEGQSFNKPIMVNGKEDYAKSRRVELKLKVKKWDVSSALGFMD